MWICIAPDFEKINFIANGYEKLNTSNGSSEEIYIAIADRTEVLEGR